MLVLNRKLGEAIVLPGLNVSINVVEVHGQRVRLGICAPPSVVVLRSELADAASLPRDKRRVRNKESRDATPKSALGRPAFAVSK